MRPAKLIKAIPHLAAWPGSCRITPYTISLLRLTCVTLLAGIICSHHGLHPNSHTIFIFKCHSEQHHRVGFARVPNRRDSSVMNTGFPEKVLRLLESVAETDEVRRNLELP